MKKRNIVFLTIIFGVSFVLYYIGILNAQNVYDSDYDYYAIAGKDILSGNIFLKGWYGATNTFYFLALLYGVFGKIFGYSIGLLYIVSSFVWALFLTIVSYFVCLICNEDEEDKSGLRLLVVFTLASMSCYFSQSIKILGGCHLDALILGLVYVWNISRNNIQWKKMVLASLCFVLAIFSDELVLYFFALPVILVSLFKLLKNVKNKKNLLVFVLTIFLTGFTKVGLNILGKMGGIKLTWNTSSISFVERENLFDRIAYTIEELIYIFNADLFGKKIGTDAFIQLINFLLVCIIVGILIKNFNKLKQSFFNQILIVSGFLQVVILLFTSYIDLSIDIDYTSRIMYYFFTMVIFLLAQGDLFVIPLLKEYKDKRKIKVMICIFLCAINVLNISQLKLIPKAEEKNKYQKVAEELEKRKLQCGYGTFWLSNVVTLTSKCNIYVNPICNASNISKYKWLSFDTNKWKEANFVLVDDSMWDNISKQTIIESIGKPNEEIQVDNISIMIWNKNIMPYIDDSGANRNLDYWWDGDGTETNKKIDVTNKHFFSQFEARDDGTFISDSEGQLIYGPYVSMKKGTYDITFEYSSPIDTKGNIGYVDVFSASDKIEYQKQDMKINSDFVTIHNIRVKDDCEDAEMRSYVYIPNVSIKKIIVKKLL